MKTRLLEEIVKRRKELQLSTSDMPLRTGLNRQQYDRIERRGNPSLSTLDKIAEGLDAELVLVPKEMLKAVRRLLASPCPPAHATMEVREDKQDYLSDEIADPLALLRQHRSE